MYSVMAGCWSDLQEHVAKCFTSANYNDTHRDASPKSRGEYSDLNNELDTPLYIAAIDAATPEDVDEPQACSSTLAFSHSALDP